MNGPEAIHTAHLSNGEQYDEDRPKRGQRFDLSSDEGALPLKFGCLLLLFLSPLYLLAGGGLVQRGQPLPADTLMVVRSRTKRI